MRHETVTRYVATHIGSLGLRTLMTPAQGRHTYATPEEAQAWLDAVKANNSQATLASLYSSPDTWEVRPCECFANHFDPVGIYFDT